MHQSRCVAADPAMAGPASNLTGKDQDSRVCRRMSLYHQQISLYLPFFSIDGENRCCYRLLECLLFVFCFCFSRSSQNACKVCNIVKVPFHFVSLSQNCAKEDLASEIRSSILTFFSPKSKCLRPIGKYQYAGHFFIREIFSCFQKVITPMQDDTST